ncbi:MAG: pyruvate dehydrogenase complex dihydrolipoamide acetyltransferase [Simkaniaceae bacterium]|nr:pyruvate dehydrogenase complex dihydrolipoamide acetyltransferase [Simkaniaceae bacterium]
MPKLSPTMEEGVIAKWHVKEGDQIKDGDLLMEVATDKATVEYNALDGGYLRKILVPEGSSASVNQPIAIFSESADENIDDFTPQEEKPTEEAGGEEVAEQPKAAAAPSQPTSGGLAQPAFQPPPPLESHTFEWPAEPPSQRVMASPVAKNLAKEQGVDLTTVKGSGPGGRIVKADVEKAQAGGYVAFGSREVPKEVAGSFESVELSPMRKAIGQRLQESKTFIPHFYVSQEVDAGPMFELRAQLKEGGIKLTFNDFVMRATALALRKYPDVNAGFNTVDNTITHYKTVDISVAVTIDGGLITPIVRWADYKNIAELSKEVKELATLAKKGKLQPEQYQGGSFTLSNLGMYGVSEFIAVINPPQAAILAVGGILDKPVVDNGVVIPGKVMKITLAADHRVVDGALGAEFTREVKKLLENPSILLIN